MVIATVLPAVPEQFSVYVVSCVSGPTLCEPVMVLVPDQPPDALQVLTLTPVQLSVEFVLRATLRGFADRLTEGPPLDVTVTLAVLAAVSAPAPAQVRVKLAFAVRLPVLCVPDVPREPLHEPEAAQLVAFVVVHVSCEAAPDCTEVGDAVSVTVGAPAAETVTDALREMEPPAPVHARV